MLIALAVPITLMLASAVPSPAAKVKPAVPLRVNVPLVTRSVIWLLAPPASASVMKMALPLALENTLVVSSAVLCAPGTVLVGGAAKVTTLAQNG